jgi:nucleotide-binding universal stress UspA family protein
MTSDEKPALAELEVRHVLVPLDGSELSLQAMPTARELARRLGADVQTVSVVGAEDADRVRILASAAVGAEMGEDRVFVVRDGEPAEVIARRARELGSCVVCMSTHGRGRLRGAVIGSVARSVLERSEGPIVALGPMADNPGWTPRPWDWPEPLSVPRIVACVDGSDAAEQVLPLAATWAQALNMSMTIVTMIEDAPPPERPERLKSRYGSHADAESYIDALAQEWGTGPCDVDGLVVRDPLGPASGLRAHLEERPAGLVAVTTHARSGWRRALLGAGAASIVRASVAPCLVAPVRA